MENYTNVDRNMIVPDTLGELEVIWHDVRKPPFSIHGLYQPETAPFFHRLPLDLAAAVSPGVDKMHRECAGGRVRFSTDSPFIAIRIKFLAVSRNSHMTLVSVAGCDLYIDGEYGSRSVREFRMPYDMTDGYEQVLELDGAYDRSYTLNLPVHACVASLEIGLKPGAKLGPAKAYRPLKPIVFYGSSIVHGTAAGRPGNIYPLVISRMLNADVVNLGFSGQAKGERNLAEWMAEQPMSIFVCDYDHNAPDPEHLAATHYPMYEVIREKNPDLPYIMITRPNYWTNPQIADSVLKRREVVMESYLKARKNGDQNVHFIDGMSFFCGPHQYENTLDAVHPNDAGFLHMADVIGAVIRHILEMKAEKN